MSLALRESFLVPFLPFLPAFLPLFYFPPFFLPLVAFSPSGLSPLSEAALAYPSGLSINFISFWKVAELFSRCDDTTSSNYLAASSIHTPPYAAATAVRGRWLLKSRAVSGHPSRYFSPRPNTPKKPLSYCPFPSRTTVSSSGSRLGSYPRVILRIVRNTSSSVTPLPTPGPAKSSRTKYCMWREASTSSLSCPSWEKFSF